MKEEKKELSIEEINKRRQEEIDKLLKNGEYGSMTECAYGKTIADIETSKKISKENEKK